MKPILDYLSNGASIVTSYYDLLGCTNRLVQMYNYGQVNKMRSQGSEGQMRIIDRSC